MQSFPLIRRTNWNVHRGVWPKTTQEGKLFRNVMSHRSVFYDLEMRDVWTGMADTIVLPIAGLGILVMDRAGFEAALSAGRALIPPEAPSPHTKPRSSDAGLLDAEQLEAVTAIPATCWMAAARARRIPFRKIGRRVRFVLEEIIACEELKRRELEQVLPRESLAIKPKRSGRYRPRRQS